MDVYGKIVVLKRSGQDSASFELVDEKYTFGRAVECDIRIQLLSVAEHHCFISRSQDGRAVLNCVASNGLSVNGKELDAGASVVLCDGDLITVVERIFRYECKPSVAAVAASDSIPATATAASTETPKKPTAPTSSLSQNVFSVSELASSPHTPQNPSIARIAASTEQTPGGSRVPPSPLGSAIVDSEISTSPKLSPCVKMGAAECDKEKEKEASASMLSTECHNGNEENPFIEGTGQQECEEATTTATVESTTAAVESIVACATEAKNDNVATEQSSSNTITTEQQPVAVTEERQTGLPEKETEMSTAIENPAELPIEGTVSSTTMVTDPDPQEQQIPTEAEQIVSKVTQEEEEVSGQAVSAVTEEQVVAVSEERVVAGSEEQSSNATATATATADEEQQPVGLTAAEEPVCDSVTAAEQSVNEATTIVPATEEQQPIVAMEAQAQASESPVTGDAQQSDAAVKAGNEVAEALPIIEPPVEDAQPLQADDPTAAPTTSAAQADCNSEQDGVSVDIDVCEAAVDHVTTGTDSKPATPLRRSTRKRTSLAPIDSPAKRTRSSDENEVENEQEQQESAESATPSKQTHRSTRTRVMEN